MLITDAYRYIDLLPFRAFINSPFLAAISKFCQMAVDAYIELSKEQNRRNFFDQKASKDSG